MFEKATRKKLRFASAAGQLTVEDLWDMPLQAKHGRDLDTMAKNLNRSIKEHEEESFVTRPNAANTLIALKFDIVKHVIKVKMEEADNAKKRKDNADKKQRLLSLMADKENEELKGKSVEELQKLIAELED